MASLRDETWPDDGGNGDDGDGDGTRPRDPHSQPGQHTHGGGSGPLCDAPEQITETLNARLVRRFTSPNLGSQSECGAGQGECERGDTDEVEVLSEVEARILRRYMAAPTPAWMARPAHAMLPPLLPDLSDPTHPTHPPRPTLPPPSRTTYPPFMVAGGNGYVAAHPAVHPAAQIAVAPAPAPVAVPSVQAVGAYPPPYQPVNITRLVLAQFHLSVQDGLLPPNVLAWMDSRERRIFLAPALAPLLGTYGSWGTCTERLEQVIEARPITRFVLAALYARWHSRMPDGVPDAPCYVAAFSPVSGLMQHEWRAWHGPLYTRLYAQTCRLINPIEGKLTAVYLGLRGGGAYNRYGMPRLGADLHSAVTRRALTIVPALREACHSPQEFSERAWVHFTLWAARCIGVPSCVVRDRLDGDRRAIRTPDDLCRWTDELLADAPEVAEWRAQTARAFGLQAETRRDGRYMTAAQRVALWCAEPSMALVR